VPHLGGWLPLFTNCREGVFSETQVLLSEIFENQSTLVCSRGLSYFSKRVYTNNVGTLAEEGGKAMGESPNRGMQAPEGAREWLSQMQNLSEQIQKQQQNSQQMMQELMNTYMQLLNTPGSYASEQAQQQQQTLQQVAQQWMQQAEQQQQTFQQQAQQQQQQSFQQMIQESMNTYMQMFNIPHSYAQEGMRLAQEDTQGSSQEEVRDQIRKSQRRSAGQSS
jgi:hypothetical protein